MGINVVYVAVAVDIIGGERWWVSHVLSADHTMMLHCQTVIYYNGASSLIFSRLYRKYLGMPQNSTRKWVWLSQS